jgi:hypothetical protein
MESYHTEKRHGVQPLYNLLDAVKEKEDLQFAFRFFRIMCNRYLKFREDTMKRLCEVLFKFEEYPSVIERKHLFVSINKIVVKHRNLLRLPVDSKTAQYILENLLEVRDLTLLTNNLERRSQ